MVILATGYSWSCPGLHDLIPENDGTPVRLRRIETQLRVFLGVNFDLYDGMGRNLVAKRVMAEGCV